MKNKLAIFATSSALLASLLMMGVASAQTTTAPAQGGHWPGSEGGQRMPGVFGTVSAINGTTLTLTSKGFGQNATATTYTVDASNATVTKNNSSSSVSDIAVGDSVMVQGTVSGTSVTATTIRDGMMMMRGGMGMKPGVFGTVSAINGTTLTVTSKGFAQNQNTTGTTYTVNAANATVTKNNASSSLSAIAVGDTVMVQGTVSGTSVTATAIHDGVIPQGGQGPQSPIIQGNGEPVVGGAITAINGTSLTITNKSNVTYTVDVSSATVEKGNATSSVSSLTVGDNVVVQGTVNGNAVTASSVIDSGASSNSGGSSMDHGLGGVMGAIGGFFKHIFGFF